MDIRKQLSSYATTTPGRRRLWLWLTVHANPFDNLKHRGVNLAVGLVLVMILLQLDDGHRLSLIDINLLSQRSGNGLDATLTAD